MIGARIGPWLFATVVLSCLAWPLIGHAEGAPDDRAAISAASRAFSAAYIANDVEGLKAIYTADAVLLAPGKEIRGRNEAGEYFRWRPGYRQVDHAMTTDELLVRGDTAIDVGTWHSIGQRGDAEPSSASGRYLVVWVRESDGAWRIKYDMWHRPEVPEGAGAEAQ